jgi:hypothetical protein
MLSDQAKVKIVETLKPLYVDPDFATVQGDFSVTVNTVPVTPTPDTETVDVPRV